MVERRSHARPANTTGRCASAVPFCVIAASALASLSAAAGIDSADDDSNSTTTDESSQPAWRVALSYLFIVVLICMSALFAGLTLGLLSLDKIGLQVIESGADPKLAAYARKISPVRANGNRLLCTLLLGNVCTNALLSILMAGLTSGLMGFFISSALITVFGEIVPQAVCSRHALRIGAATVPVVRVIIVLFLPFTFLLSLALDKMLGEEIGTLHTQVELRELMQIHVKHGAIDLETGREVQGALQYRARLVHEVMTPIDKVYMLHVSARLDFRVISEIFKAGFSRVPVWDKDKNDIKGLVLVKDLIFIDPEDETPVKNFVELFGRGLQVVWHDQSLGEVLTVFKQGKSHMAIVRDVNNSGPGDPYYEVKGIITLEDIIETILGDEIVDETDTFVDMNRPDLPLKRQNFDMSRLRLLNGDADVDKLSPQEAQAVTAHLLANVPQFAGMPAAMARDIVTASPVLNLVRTAADTYHQPPPEDVLYRRGRPSDTAMLVLNGKVAVTAGSDGFRSEVGAWTILAGGALVEAGGDGLYRPDFNAYIASERVRCIQISARTFRSPPPPPPSPKGKPPTLSAAAFDQRQQQEQEQLPQEGSSSRNSPADARLWQALADMAPVVVPVAVTPPQDFGGNGREEVTGAVGADSTRLSEEGDDVPLIGAVQGNRRRGSIERRGSGIGYISSSSFSGNFSSLEINGADALAGLEVPLPMARSLSLNSRGSPTVSGGSGSERRRSGTGNSSGGGLERGA